MTNYGPWTIWNGIDDISQADVARSDSDLSTVAYREVIEPEVVRYCHYDPNGGGLIFGGHGTLKGDISIRITVQGDNIKAEWVE